MALTPTDGLGRFASLLLAFVDAQGRFINVSAGLPGCFGDAGAFNNSLFKKKIDEGLLSATWSLTAGDDTRVYNPFLVGDVAFPLSIHMQKCFSTSPGEHSREGKYNKWIINCRREVERTFGKLKGWWAFCMRNSLWGSPKFNKDAHLVCCGLHNYVENRYCIRGATGCQRRSSTSTSKSTSTRRKYECTRRSSPTIFDFLLQFTSE